MGAQCVHFVQQFKTHEPSQAFYVFHIFLHVCIGNQCSAYDGNFVLISMVRVLLTTAVSYYL